MARYTVREVKETITQYDIEAPNATEAIRKYNKSVDSKQTRHYSGHYASVESHITVKKVEEEFLNEQPKSISTD